jgi:hypothetical protein
MTEQLSPSKAVVDQAFAISLAKLRPNREHESSAVTGLCCRVGLHRWRKLDLAELVPNREVRFYFWCSKIRIDRILYDP